MLLVDQRLDQFNDSLLACSSGVQRAANLGETTINLLEPPIDVTTHIDEVLSESVKAGRCGDAKIADVGSDLSDVPVGRASQYPGSCGDVFHGHLQCVNAPLEIILTHRVENTWANSARVPLISGALDKGRRDLRPRSQMAER